METAAEDKVFWRRSLVPRESGRVNVGPAERMGSLAIGAVLIGASFRRGPLGRIVLRGLGALAILRAASGHSEVYERAGISSADLAHGAGIDIVENVTINAPAADVYARWTDLTQLPRYMSFVSSITQLTPDVTHWVVDLPGERKLEWDAEIIDRRENELVAWHTLPGTSVEHSGAVRFHDVPGRGTEMQLKLRFVPPGGAAGFVIARLAHVLEQRGVAEELRRFKAIVEAGEAPTIEGQTSGRAREQELPPRVATAPVKQRVEPRGPIGEV